ncbi:hypothetical protein JQC91_00355 [Jannaschia sp. Os4]|uniref:hypothetical protein n=1 Tax=Jannaschia sp. Os4 TaxID=2807617 RepID=UPI00193AA59C|nr:hypothetical protein [Jannaschia sp. Os4]MBM2574741.1 hypothetical protein [Jannaschia sp. Os4]
MSDAFWSESGPVELGTAALLAILTAVLLWRAVRAPRLWHLPMLGALLTMREFDLDKAVEPGLLKARTYSGDAPLAVKLLGLFVIVLALVCLWRVARDLPAAWRALRAGAAWPWLVGTAIVAVVVAKSFDGIGRKLAPFGIDVPPETVLALSRVEEVLELLFALLLLIAATVAWRRGTDAPPAPIASIRDGR